MNVRDLIEALTNLDPDAEVHFSYNYGDHWRTTVAPVVGNVNEGTVIWSGYHDMPKVTDDGDDGDQMTKKGFANVVLISA